MKISDEFIRECVEERLDNAVRSGVNRAYKHSDAAPPTDAQVETICDAVRSAFYDIFECVVPQEREA